MAGAKIYPIIDAKGNLITTVYGWNHSTVADGCELTNMTIEPICSALNRSIGEVKDFIEELSALSSRVDSFYDEYSIFNTNVIASADELDKKTTYLSGQIDTLKAATDVIAVFGTYSEFTNASAGEWQQQVTDNDIIKVLSDESLSSKQVYYEYHISAHDGWDGWSAIGTLDPYYSKSDFNTWSADRFTDTSANYALVAADSKKLDGNLATNIILSANAGSAASAWLLANAKNYITTAEYIPQNPNNYIDCTLSAEQINNTSASKLTVKIKPIDSFVGSAQSGKSAYDWITTKSATLSAGDYIVFTSAAQNTLGITVSGIYPHRSGNCISVDPVPGQLYSRINLSSDIFVDSLNSSAVYEVVPIGTVTSYFSANASSINFERNSTYGAGMYNTSKIRVDGVDFHDNGLDCSFSWMDLYNGLAGHYVQASADQTIKVATATTALTPSDMEDGCIYIV